MAILKPKEMAERLGVAVLTLQRWNNNGTLYKRIKYYQRKLAKKRVVNGKKATKTNNYVKTRDKLQRNYRKIANVQHDIIQKSTTELVINYDQIVIEDLDVKKCR